MSGIRLRLLVFAVVVASALFQSGWAAAQAPTLAGETFTAFNIQSPLTPDQPGEVSVRARCDLTGNSMIHFEASGVATGPYPGTFEEKGHYKIGPQTFPGGDFPSGPLISFHSVFRIESEEGIVHGTKRMDAGPVGRCFEFQNMDFGLGGLGFLLGADGHFVFGDALEATYKATIHTTEGTFHDSGVTRAIVQEVDATGILRESGTETRLVEGQFIEQFGTPAEP